MTPLDTVENADAFFATRLYSRAWTDSTPEKKQLALNDSTRIINLFDYIGEPSVSGQENQWPRSGVYYNNLLLSSDTIPEGILIAFYEIAHALLKGIDPEKEIQGLRVTSRGYASVRTTYDPTRIPEYFLFGVPSATAWSYLSPFLRRDKLGNIKIHRVS